MYNSWWQIFFNGHKYSSDEENHKCKNPKAAIKFLKSMVATKEHNIDLLLARTDMKKREEELFTKMIGVPVKVLNNVEGNYENQRRRISIEVPNRQLTFFVEERKTSLGFQMSGMSGRELDVEEVKQMIKVLTPN